MLSIRTHWRLCWLSLWTPPPGVQHQFIVSDDGTIRVHLECGRNVDGIEVRPGPRLVPWGGIFWALDRLAKYLQHEEFLRVDGIDAREVLETVGVADLKDVGRVICERIAMIGREHGIVASADETGATEDSGL